MVIKLLSSFLFLLIGIMAKFSNNDGFNNKNSKCMPPEDLKFVNKTILIISIGLLLISFTQKCYCNEIECGDSLAVYLAGVFGFYLSWAGIAWLANPLLLISWITVFRNPKMSLVASVLASVLCLSFLFFKEIIDNEGGYYRQIVGYKLGYWLWVASILTMFVGNILLYFLSRSNKKFGI